VVWATNSPQEGGGGDLTAAISRGACVSRCCDQSKSLVAARLSMAMCGETEAERETLTTAAWRCRGVCQLRVSCVFMLARTTKLKCLSPQLSLPPRALAPLAGALPPRRCRTWAPPMAVREMLRSECRRMRRRISRRRRRAGEGLRWHARRTAATKGGPRAAASH
jgi:hypothetical protein